MQLFRHGALSAVLVSCLALAACGGGGGSSSSPVPPGGGGGVTPTPVPVVTPTPTPGPGSSSTQSVTAGAAPAMATFGPISNGLSGSAGLPAASSGTASITEVLSTGLPAGTPALKSVKRAPRDIGAAGITAIAYVSFTANANVAFGTTPSFAFTVIGSPTLVTAPTPGYIAFYDPTASANGWTTLLGPVTIGGSATTWTFPGGAFPMTFKPGSTYVYALFAASSAVATPSPTPVPTSTPLTSPSPSTTPTIVPTASPTAVPTASPTAVPTATPTPAFAAAPTTGLLAAVPGGAFGGVTAAGSSGAMLVGVATNLRSSSGGPVTSSGIVSVGVNGVGGQSYRRASSHDVVDTAGLSIEWQPRVSQRITAEIRRTMQRNPGGGHSVESVRRTRALPTTVGATAKLWAQNAAIGSNNGTYKQVDATLAAVTAHGAIWVDSTLSSVLSSSSTIQQIGADFENGYASDSAHFGSNVYDPTTYRATNYCDANGNVTGSGLPYVASDPHTVVFVVNPQSLGGGVGGYFDSVNFIADAALQCFANARSAGLHSNDEPMIYLGWFGPGGGSSPLSYVLQEDLVRSAAHEYQHLINFVQHGIVSNGNIDEDLFINEGLSMLAQDLAVSRMYPQLRNDVADAMRHANIFLAAPQNFSLTGFSGIDGSAPAAPAFNCSGCYGTSYMFQRYLYDRFGGDGYLAQVEIGATTGLAKIGTITGQSSDVLLSDFGLALAANGSSSDPRYRMPGFPFGQNVTSQVGTSVFARNTGTVNVLPGPGIFPAPFDGGYVFISVPAGGSTVTIREKTGMAGFKAGIAQH
jgi:hypothetical protein